MIISNDHYMPVLFCLAQNFNDCTETDELSDYLVFLIQDLVSKISKKTVFTSFEEASSVSGILVSSALLAVERLITYT